VPDFSRRARGFAVYAALRSLGRAGVAEVVERCCACARHFADVLGAEPGIEILNEVVLNQVLVRFGGDDATTDAVVAAVQADRTCWMGPTTWRGLRAMRISVSNWATTISDVDRSCAAILDAARAPLAPPRSR
jgi:glutamate/tyrosine decarboxylase-like PLP-dependent enzyme